MTERPSWLQAALDRRHKAEPEHVIKGLFPPPEDLSLYFIQEIYSGKLRAEFGSDYPLIWQAACHMSDVAFRQLFNPAETESKIAEVRQEQLLQTLGETRYMDYMTRIQKVLQTALQEFETNERKLDGNAQSR